MHPQRRTSLAVFVLVAAAVAFTLPRRRVYLTRGSLSAPRRSAIAKLLAAKDKMAYISAFGFDVDAFEHLLSLYSPHLPPPPARHRRPRCLTPQLHLALALYYLTTPARQKSIAIIFGIVPACVSREIWTGLRTLCVMMDSDPDTWSIKWPTAATMKSMAAAVHAREPLLQHVFGFVDGLNLRIYQPRDLDEQNAYYNGWLSDTYCSQVLVFLPNGEIAWVSYNNPGSWHDSKFAQPLYNLLLDPQRTPAPFVILADSAFPYGADVADRILSKPKDKVALKETDGNVVLRWEAIIRQRQAAEWGMRALQSAFGRLDLRLPTNKSKRALILTSIFSLHNFRARHVGLDQIRTVYFPQWQRN